MQLTFVPLTWLLTPSSLRDMAQSTEQEQRRRIAEMEKDITSIDDLQGPLYSSFPCLRYF